MHHHKRCVHLLLQEAPRSFLDLRWCSHCITSASYVSTVAGEVERGAGLFGHQARPPPFPASPPSRGLFFVRPRQEEMEGSDVEGQQQVSSGLLFPLDTLVNVLVQKGLCDALAPLKGRKSYSAAERRSVLVLVAGLLLDEDKTITVARLIRPVLLHVIALLTVDQPAPNARTHEKLLIALSKLLPLCPAATGYDLSIMPLM